MNPDRQLLGPLSVSILKQVENDVLAKGMTCPHCGGSNTEVIRITYTYGDCWCNDCKKWCGFED